MTTEDLGSPEALSSSPLVRAPATAGSGRTGFTCPRCSRTSHNPFDIEEGYCGHCHAWTAEPASSTRAAVRRLGGPVPAPAPGGGRDLRCLDLFAASCRAHGRGLDRAARRLAGSAYETAPGTYLAAVVAVAAGLAPHPGHTPEGWAAYVQAWRDRTASGVAAGGEE